jgi:hypothetical protein
MKWIPLALLMACGSDGGNDSSEADADTDTDADSDADTDTNVGCPYLTDFPEISASKGEYISCAEFCPEPGIIRKVSASCGVGDTGATWGLGITVENVFLGRAVLSIRGGADKEVELPENHDPYGFLECTEYDVSFMQILDSELGYPCDAGTAAGMTFIMRAWDLDDAEIECLVWGADPSHADAAGCVDISDWEIKNTTMTG